jgi:hypothetical protein
MLPPARGISGAFEIFLIDQLVLTPGRRVPELTQEFDHEQKKQGSIL